MSLRLVFLKYLLFFLFFRNELYKECVAALQGGVILAGRNFNAIRDALIEAFQSVDAKLLGR